MGYGDFKNLAKGTASNKVLKDKADPKYDGYQRGLISKKKTAGSDIKSMPQNEQLAEELHKPIIQMYIQHSNTTFWVLI